MANRWGNNGNSRRLNFFNIQNHRDSDCSHEIKRHLFLGNLPGGSMVKCLPACRRPGFNLWVAKIPLEEEMATHSSILAWKIPMDREAWSGYSPWFLKESDRTKRLFFLPFFTPWKKSYDKALTKLWQSIVYLIHNTNSVLKSRDITLSTKVRLVKAMVFPIVMYGCESWTLKKAEHWRTNVFELWGREDSWESLGLQGDPTSPS